MSTPPLSATLPVVLLRLPGILPTERLRRDSIVGLVSLLDALSHHDFVTAESLWRQLWHQVPPLATLTTGLSPFSAFKANDPLIVRLPQPSTLSMRSSPPSLQDTVRLLEDALPLLAPLIRVPLLEFPEIVQVGSSIPISVSLTDPEGEEQGLVKVPRGPQLSVIEVLLEPLSTGLRLEEPDVAKLEVPEKHRGHGVTYHVRADRPGSHPFRISFRTCTDREPLGSPVERCLEAFKAPTVHRTVRSTASGLALSRPSSAIPDVTLHFRRLADDERFCFQMEVSCDIAHLRLDRMPMGSVRLHQEPSRFLHERFNNTWLRTIAGIKAEEGPEAAETMLRAEALDMTEQLLPEAFLCFYRDELEPVLRHSQRRPTWIIYSDETWIPWEMMLLTRANSVREFLVERYAVTRWNVGRSAPPYLCHGRWGVVLPRSAQLGEMDEELHSVAAISDGDPLRLARLGEVQRGLRDEPVAGWHFITHGRFDHRDVARSGLELDGGRLTASQLMQPLPRADILQGPLAFLNACETGIQGLSLSGLGGLVQAFIKQGAAAVVGTSWSVPNRKAIRFAAAFYRALRVGDSVAEATTKAREEIHEPGDPSWLCYAVWGHPDARVWGRHLSARGRKQQ